MRGNDGSANIPATITVEGADQAFPSGVWTALVFDRVIRQNLMTPALPSADIPLAYSGTWHVTQLLARWIDVGFGTDWLGGGARVRVKINGALVWPFVTEDVPTPDRGLPVPAIEVPSVPTFATSPATLTVEVRQDSGASQFSDLHQLTVSLREPRQSGETIPTPATLETTLETRDVAVWWRMGQNDYNDPLPDLSGNNEVGYWPWPGNVSKVSGLTPGVDAARMTGPTLNSSGGGCRHTGGDFEWRTCNTAGMVFKPSHEDVGRTALLVMRPGNSNSRVLFELDVETSEDPTQPWAFTEPFGEAGQDQIEVAGGGITENWYGLIVTYREGEGIIAYLNGVEIWRDDTAERLFRDDWASVGITCGYREQDLSGFDRRARPMDYQEMFMARQSFSEADVINVWNGWVNGS